MKKKMTATTRFFIITFSMLGFAPALFAQESATATATAVIVTPISITNSADMNFGNVSVSSVTDGTVILTPAGTRSATDGVTLPATAGTVAAAAFEVNGESAYSYDLTLPSSALTITSGANTMTVTTFTSTPASNWALTAGTQNITVGATLNVTAAQPSGTYVSATPFEVSVIYN